MVKTTNAQLDNDKSYKYGCNNDGYGNYSYRSEINGVKCHNSKRMNDQFDIQAEKLVAQLEFLVRDDAKHFTPHYFEQSAFRINPLKLINKIHMKLVAPHLKKKELVHTSESISYKKSEDLIPLNDPVINVTHIQPSCPVKPNKPMKKSRKVNKTIEPIKPIVEPNVDIVNEFTHIPYESELSDDEDTIKHMSDIINDIEDITDSPISYDSNADVNDIILDIDDELDITSDNKYEITKICLDYVNVSIPFYIVLKDFNKKRNKITYIKVIHMEDYTFIVDKLEESDLSEPSYMNNRYKYISGINSDYYEIVIESKYNIHNDK